MIPRERILAAMNREIPDRVPVMCQFSFGFMNQQLKNSGISPMEFWLDAGQYARGLMNLRKRFNFDGILVSVHGHAENWKEKIRNLETIDGIEVATFDNRTEKYVDDDLPVGNYFEHTERDIFSADPSEIPAELDFINASKDCYIYIDTANPYRVFSILEKELKGKYSIHAEVSSPLDYLLDYLDYENALVAMAMDPEKVKIILEKFTVGIIKMAEGLAENCDIDAIKISSPFAGSDFISPDYYREYELPYLKRVSDAIKAKGKFSYVHTCGHINDRLEIMKEAGLSGIECLDPPPIGDVELDNAFNRIGDEMFIKGNIDSVNTLLNGEEDLVKTDIRKRIETGISYRGFILSTACSIAPRVPEERIALLSDLVKQHGKYT